jgi:hypothetical protein
MEHTRLRVGGWVDHLQDTPAPTSGAGPHLELPPLEPVDDTEALAFLAPVEGDRFDDDLDDYDDRAYRGRRRRRGERGQVRPHRLALVAVVVGLLLMGGGTLVRSVFLTGPDTLPGPPPAPEHTRAAPTAPMAGGAELGLAPTGDPGAGPTAPPQGTGQPDPEPLVASYEAEAATLGSHATVETWDGASGGRVTRLGGAPSGAYVEFTAVTADEVGRYRLTILYASDRDRTLQISVNGGEQVTVTAQGRGDQRIGTVSVEVDLDGGSNTVRVGTSGGRSLLLDGIVIGD